MKTGIQISRFDWPGNPENTGPKLAEIAKSAEASGFDSIWVMDHYFQIAPFLGKRDDPMLESYTTLGYLASVTQRVKLGVMVVGVIYREPAFLIKQASTLDVLSGGRTYFGIGAAWYEQEAKSLGFTFPSTKERFERLEETLQIAKQMWSGDRKAFKGVYYKLEEPINSPQPLSKPHPPILVGGGGEKKTLKLVAKYADACNLFYRPNLSHKLEVLKNHCKDVGRDYDEIEKTVLMMTKVSSSGDAKVVVEMCEEIAPLGIDHIIFSMPIVHESNPLEIFRKEIIPSVNEL